MAHRQQEHPSCSHWFHTLPSLALKPPPCLRAFAYVTSSARMLSSSPASSIFLHGWLLRPLERPSPTGLPNHLMVHQQGTAGDFGDKGSELPPMPSRVLSSPSTYSTGCDTVFQAFTLHTSNIFTCKLRERTPSPTRSPCCYST